ncbi:hypothetical protein P3X46_023922 [Hevea brasiliensis]|uniref:Uncharacterized protein n=1 Tax=Hevea brasiliensis TaxID=3981 RepID=A0ABQ9LCG3_HEVBR|nr:hypothetical protein P3X46_023922 [Hevea brasiliensis]
MSSPNATELNLFQRLPLGIIWKSSVAIAGLVFFYAFLFSHNLDNQSSDSFVTLQLKRPASSPNVTIHSPTNISHIGFIVISSLNSWKNRNPYILSWWRPNVTRGCIFLDKEPTQEYLPWPSTSPPYRVNEDVTKLSVYPKLVSPDQVRMFRSILDMYRVGDNKDLRWFMMCDDDTILLVDNLVEVLQKYDHTNYFYIGDNSECVKSNADFSFDMGFGGAGYALSYPLVEALSTKLDACIERYPQLYVSDHMAQSCLADIGVALTIEKGIHQIDLHDDISGLLSAHPQSPLLSLHHFDFINPIFPSMDRYQATNHLMTAAKYDQSRFLQQTICYHRERNWSFSVSWGYSTHIYEKTIPRSILRKPLETFKPWRWNGSPPLYMFNTRWVNNDPCDAPHVFFFQSIEYNASGNQLLTTYIRASPRNLPPCSVDGNHSADSISEILVLSPATTRKTAGVIECCDVEYKAEMNITEIKIR